MPGLVDATTGLEFGTGLQFQTAIGGAGLDITTGVIPAGTLYWGSADLLWGAGDDL